MRDLLDKFCDCFPTIDFNIKRKEIKHQLSIETVTTGEREIERMLTEAKRNLSRAKKLHKQGKMSAEEVFDHEYRVHELEQELDRFKDLTDDLDEDLLDF